MSRISGAVPQLSYGPTPIAGGTPQSIQAAYNRNFATADQINRGLAGSIERGYQDLASQQRSAQDLLGSGYADLGARARQRQAEMQSQIIGDPSRKFDPGHLGRLQDAFDWLQEANQREAAGYKQLYSDAMGDVSTLGQTERTDLEERYRRAGADAAMGLARRGLGNSTLVANAQRGVEADRARASIALSDSLARERLDVRNRFGMAEQQALERQAERNREQQNLIGRTRADFAQRIAEWGGGQELGAYQNSLAAQERGYNANTALGQSQLNWMNSIQAPYPNAGQYAQLAQAAGASRVDPYGGGTGIAGGGMTVTRGGPWNPPGLRNEAGNSPVMDARGNIIGYGSAAQNIKAAMNPPTAADFGGLDPRWVSAYQPGRYNEAFTVNAGLTPQNEPSPYSGGGGTGSAGGGQPVAPTSGGVFVPTGGGFGGGYGQYVEPDQLNAPVDWLFGSDVVDESQAPVDWLFGSDVGGR